MAPQAKFLSGNLMHHVSVMAFTGSIGLMALFLVDLVDLVFISMLGQTELAAAVGYSGAILFFTVSVGIGLAIALGALVARSLGAGDPERARAYATNTLTFAGLISIFIAAGVWLLVPDLLLWVGATGQTRDLAITYLRIIVPSMPILVIGMGMSAILRAHGDASRAMWVTIAGGLVNAILDPILIFALDMGLNGAAWASVSARVAVFLTATVIIWTRYGGLARPSIAGLRADVLTISALAVPAILTNVATPVGNAFVTAMLAPFGDSAVAGLSVVGRLTPVAFAVIFSLSGAIGPIVGQNFGAQRHDRVRRTILNGLKFNTIYVLCVTVLLFALRQPLASLFSLEGDAVTLLYLFCGPLALGFMFNGALFVSNAALNNLNRPTFSTVLNWGRNTLGVIPFTLLGAQLAGAPGVLIGQMLGGIVFGTLGVWITLRLISRYENGRIDRNGRPTTFSGGFSFSLHSPFRR